MKKLIALVLTVAMLVTCFAFSASAETTTTPELVAEGPANAVVGDTITVKIRLNDTEKVVGGVQGTITATNATVDSVTVNPDLQTWNDTKDNATIYKLENNVITFAAVNALKDSDTKYDTRVWFIITYVVGEGETKIDVEAKAATKDAATQNIVCKDLSVAKPVIEEGTPEIKLTAMGIKDEVDVLKQGIVVKGTFDADPSKITEFGVLFLPTSLVPAEGLKVENADAIVAKVDNNNSDFANYVNADEFNAVLKFGFDEDVDALRFLGTKVTARVYYKDAEGNVNYATNNVDSYIQDGIANKAAMNAIVDNGDKVTVDTNLSDIDVEDYDAAKKTLNTASNEETVWTASRKTVLEFAVDNIVKE